MSKDKCKDCQEPTKVISGFWDGIGEGGRLYKCANLMCEIRQDEIKEEKEVAEKMFEVLEVNHENGVYINKLKDKRKKSKMTIRDCTRLLEISESTYSNYENYREIMPIEKYKKIMEELKDE